MRKKDASTNTFRTLNELSTLMAYEVTRDDAAARGADRDAMEAGPAR
ncbi:hypothetical protein [Candidatus Skiveiella danica]